MSNQLYKGDTPLATFAPEVVDNLTTNDSTKALSAKQGKILNDKVNAIGTNSVQKSTSSTGSVTINVSNWSKEGIIFYGGFNGKAGFGVINISPSPSCADEAFVIYSNGQSQALTVTSDDTNHKFTVSGFPNWSTVTFTSFTTTLIS